MQFFSELIYNSLIWIDSHIRYETPVIIAWATKAHSKPIFAVFVEVVRSTFVDVGVRLIGDQKGSRANAKPKVNHCQKTVYRLNIH